MSMCTLGICSPQVGGAASPPDSIPIQINPSPATTPYSLHNFREGRRRSQRDGSRAVFDSWDAFRLCRRSSCAGGRCCLGWWCWISRRWRSGSRSSVDLLLPQCVGRCRSLRCRQGHADQDAHGRLGSIRVLDKPHDQAATPGREGAPPWTDLLWEGPHIPHAYPLLCAQHGEHYFFTTKEQFCQEIAEGKFLEYAEVHGR